MNAVYEAGKIAGKKDPRNDHLPTIREAQKAVMDNEDIVLEDRELFTSVYDYLAGFADGQREK